MTADRAPHLRLLRCEPGRDPGYVELAAQVGTGLAERGIGLVYGGGRVGLMGAVADAALAAGGEVIGVIPRRLVDRELAHRGLTELRIVETLHERKAGMAALSDGFIALPGGLGTLEELAEVASWAPARAPRQADRPARPGRLLGPLLRLARPRGRGGLPRAGQSRRSFSEDADLDAFLARFESLAAARSRPSRGSLKTRRSRRALGRSGCALGFGAFVGFGVGQGIGSVPGSRKSPAATARIARQVGRLETRSACSSGAPAATG